MTKPKSKAKLRKNNSTGYRGITKTKKGWVAQINYNHKTHRLGIFTKAIDAAKCYDEEASKIFGAKAKLNFPTKVSQVVEAQVAG